MMISETAAFAGGQSSYLQQIEDQLSPGGDFPLIKAVMYFDAPGNDGAYTYPLDQSGLGEFASLVRQSRLPACTVGFDCGGDGVYPPLRRLGQRVALNAQVSNTDYGGSTSFFVNGTPLPGCQSLPAGRRFVVYDDKPAGGKQLRSRRSTAATPRSPGPRRPP